MLGLPLVTEWASEREAFLRERIDALRARASEELFIATALRSHADDHERESQWASDEAARREAALGDLLATAEGVTS